ncbi:MAG: phenylalanine--tRNA ligase subunit beta, partial [Vallitaleaceae bacterium]|nr:phenylalanine--tRNA ligase subunit beta [Vallitaleaceae bacterium]
MNISMKWLKEYVDLDLAINDYCDAMTMSGTKVETFEEQGKEITKVVVGQILSIEKHPDADKLVVTQINVGSEVIQIVTGANNISVNDYVPVALPGATLAEGLVIKKGKLRGVESNGMLCSVEELGLSREDFTEAPEHGIYIFSEEKPLGSDVKPFFGLDDTVVEYEITSNRSDCFSVMGVAREAAATFRKELKFPEIQYPSFPGNLSSEMKVSIEDESQCSRFVGRMITDVKIEESPKWLKDKLRACGVRPINNLVDITNFIMLELGQPMHAYDVDRMEHREIIVRKARAGERIMTLDGEERLLEESILVIADAEKPIGIAGVMGGEATKVMESTKTIFFEAATFNGTTIRKGSKKLGLRSDASSKFEKHLDPNLAMTAMNRACQLIDLLGAGKVMEGTIDVYPKVREKRTISYQPEAINRLLGTDISKEEMESIFRSLEFEVQE